MWSKEKIKRARLDPVCVRHGYSKNHFDISETLRVKLGGAELHRGFCLAIGGCFPVLILLPAEAPGAPCRLSAMFVDQSGRLSYLIRTNEWLALDSSYDVEVVGPNITVRDASRSIHLQIKAQPPNVVEIKRLEMKVGPFNIHIDSKGFITTVDGNARQAKIGPQAKLQGLLIQLWSNVTILKGPFPEIFSDDSALQKFLDGYWKNELTESPFAKLIKTGDGRYQLLRRPDGKPFEPENDEEMIFAVLCLGYQGPSIPWTAPFG
jgi:hypothetical protein